MRNLQTRQYRRGSRRSAFTLIELLLVMVILAILAAVVAPKMMGRGEDAKKAAAKADIHTIAGALDQFEVDNGRYPSTEEGLAVLATPITPGAHVYISKMPKDPWGNQYVYMYPGQHNPQGFDIYTTMGGKDTSGNELNNWNINAQQ